MSKTILVDEIVTSITNHDVERALRNAGYNDTPQNVKRVNEEYLTKDLPNSIKKLIEKELPLIIKSHFSTDEVDI